MSRIAMMMIGLVFWCFQTNPFAEEFHYVGVGKCKTCHKSKSQGDQYGQWLESGHAKAYETLGSDKAKEVATKLGLKEDPQKSNQCLKCHVTAHGVNAALIDTTFKITDGIQCETCHGPGSEYKSKKVMMDLELSKSKGLIIPDKKLCVECHNEKSPTYKTFNFDEMWKKINHPVPEGTTGDGSEG